MRLYQLSLLPLCLLQTHRATPVAVVDLSVAARTDIAIMAAISKLLHVKQARCVTGYSEHWISDDTVKIHIGKLGPAEVAFVDSTRIGFYKSYGDSGNVDVHICAGILPLIQARVVSDDNDRIAADTVSPRNSQAPFSVFVAVRDSTFSLRVYGFKR